MSTRWWSHWCWCIGFLLLAGCAQLGQAPRQALDVAAQLEAERGELAAMQRRQLGRAWRALGELEHAQALRAAASEGLTVEEATAATKALLRDLDRATSLLAQYAEADAALAAASAGLREALGSALHEYEARSAALERLGTAAAAGAGAAAEQAERAAAERARRKAEEEAARRAAEKHE